MIDSINHMPIAIMTTIAKILMRKYNNIPMNFTITNRINNARNRIATFVIAFWKCINITPARWYLFMSLKI